LGQALGGKGFAAVLPWGNATEHARSDQIASALTAHGVQAHVPPAMSLPDAAGLLAHAAAVVGVDTGLAHLAVALAVPTIGLYVATDPGLTGLYGTLATNLGGKGDSPTVAAVLAALARLLPAETGRQTGQNAV
jgi:heptosyltransferase I